MTQKFTAEEVRAAAAAIRRVADRNLVSDSACNEFADQALRAALADTLSKPADGGRVDDPIGHPRSETDTRDEIELFLRDAYAAGCHAAQTRSMTLAITYARREAPKLRAALAAQGQGEAVEIEAVGRVERDMTGELSINWLIEGGIHGVGEGSVLLCADRDNVTDDEGSATLYASAPPASPAGGPDLVRFAIERCLRSQEALVASIDKANPDDPYASVLVAEDIEYLRAWLAAAPSAPEGE